MRAILGIIAILAAAALFILNNLGPSAEEEAPRPPADRTLVEQADSTHGPEEISRPVTGDARGDQKGEMTREELIAVLDTKVAQLPNWPGLSYEMDLMAQARQATDVGAFIESLLPQAQTGDEIARRVISQALVQCQALAHQPGREAQDPAGMEQEVLMDASSDRLQHGLMSIERCRSALEGDVAQKVRALYTPDAEPTTHPTTIAAGALRGHTEGDPQRVRQALTRSLPSGHPGVYELAGHLAAMVELEATGEPSSAHRPWMLIGCRKRIAVWPDYECRWARNGTAVVEDAIRIADALLVEDWERIDLTSMDPGS